MVPDFKGLGQLVTSEVRSKGHSLANMNLFVQSGIASRVLEIETPDTKQMTRHSERIRMIPVLTPFGCQERSGQVKCQI